MNNGISDRVFSLLQKKGARELSRRTEINEDRWNYIKRKKGVCTVQELEILGQTYPEYRWWLISGETRPETGDLSPELENLRQDLQKTGTDTE